MSNNQTPATTTKPSNELKLFLASEKFKDQVALVLPRHITPERFARVTITALTKSPKLFECTRDSLMRCLMDCSQLGLEPDGRHAHLIPFRNTKTGGMEVQLIIDYKGLIALARRSGDVSIFRGEIVRENDDFTWINGTVTHAIDFRKDRGKIILFYSYVKFKDSAEDWEVMTVPDVDAIRARSKARDAGPWVTDYPEMGKKTAIRRHSKRLTISPEFQLALEKDDDSFEEIRNVTPVTKKPRLLGTPDEEPEPSPASEPEPEPTPEPEPQAEATPEPEPQKRGRGRPPKDKPTETWGGEPAPIEKPPPPSIFNNATLPPVAAFWEWVSQKDLYAPDVSSWLTKHGYAVLTDENVRQVNLNEILADLSV